MRYARDTSVPVERSRAEIEGVVRRYGADQFMSGWGDKEAVVAFRCKGRLIQFRLALPLRDDKQFKFTEKRRSLRSQDEAERAWEQAIRQRWRALALCIKAKLESVQANIETFDEAFLPHIVMPDGQRLSELIVPQIIESYKSGKAPKLLTMDLNGKIEGDSGAS